MRIHRHDPELDDPVSRGLAIELAMERGRRSLLISIALVLLVSLLTIVGFMLHVGPEHLPRQVVRLGLTALLMWFVWRGSAAAKWITIVLLGSAALLGMLVSVRPGTPWVFVVGYIVMSIAYGRLVLQLVLPTPVRAFVAMRGVERMMRRRVG